MSENRSGDGAAIVSGAFILAGWVYFLLFSHAEIPIKTGAWAIWGFVGILLSGAIYAGILASDVLRVVVLAVIGLCSGIIFLAVVLQQSGEMAATFITLLGGGLIVYVLPRPQPKEWNQVE